MPRNTIIAHTDVDGVCAAAIAARHLGLSYRLMFSGPRGFAETLRRVRGKGCENLIIVDIALNEDALDDIISEIRRIKGEGCARITWIDHHSWSKEAAERVAGEVELILEPAPSAARVAQRHLMPDDEVSMKIAEIGDDADTNTNALENTLAYKVAVMDPGNRRALVEAFSRGELEPPGIEEWRRMAEQELREVEEIARSAKVYRTRGGLLVGFVDMRGRRTIGSLVAKRLISDSGASIVFILYTERSGVLYGNGRVDVLGIAREFGGGGHMGASGVNFRLSLLDRVALAILGRRYLPGQARELIRRLSESF